MKGYWLSTFILHIRPSYTLSISNQKYQHEFIWQVIIRKLSIIPTLQERTQLYKVFLKHKWIWGLHLDLISSPWCHYMYANILKSQKQETQNSNSKYFRKHSVFSMHQPSTHSNPGLDIQVFCSSAHFQPPTTTPASVQRAVVIISKEDSRAGGWNNLLTLECAQLCPGSRMFLQLAWTTVKPCQSVLTTNITCPSWFKRLLADSGGTGL